MAKDSKLFFLQVQTEYEKLKVRTWNYFESAFLPPEQVYQMEQEMLSLLRNEYRKIKISRWTGQSPILEIRKVVQLFYYREKGKKVPLRDMNPYIKTFLKRKNADVFRNFSLNGHSLTDALRELIIQRIEFPEVGPKDVFYEWLPNQFERALACIPEPILEEGGFGKVCRVMAGVFLYALSDLKKNDSTKYVHSRQEKAIKGGFYYGMFYPLIDDLLDHSKVFDAHKKKELINLLNHWIVGDFSIDNTLSDLDSIYVLENILKEFHELFPFEEHPKLYDAALMLHFAQIDDAAKHFDQVYTESDLYVPVILKAAYTRILAAGISEMTIDSYLQKHMLETGLNFQLMDDFRDWVPDMDHRLLTPFTYYLLGPKNQTINPFSLYLASLRRYFKKFNDDPFLINLLMRRLSVSIQRLHDQNPSGKLQDEIWSVISNNSGVAAVVKKIHNLNYRILDPDTDYTEPIDKVVNRGVRI